MSVDNPFVNSDVYYLGIRDDTIFNKDSTEDSDIDFKTGYLKPEVSRGQPSIVMIQAPYCIYCERAKPEFAKAASLYTLYNFYTIEMIAKLPSYEKEQNINAKEQKYLDSLEGLIQKYNIDYQGIPLFLIYDSNGKFNRVYKGERTVNGFYNGLENIFGKYKK